ncbi:uncharacterized protein WM294_004468 isoform 1-T1 [Sarcoramphus papa]
MPSPTAATWRFGDLRSQPRRFGWGWCLESTEPGLSSLVELGRQGRRKSEQKPPQPKHSLWQTRRGALTGTETTVASIIPSGGQAVLPTASATEPEIFSSPEEPG